MEGTPVQMAFEPVGYSQSCRAVVKIDQGNILPLLSSLKQEGRPQMWWLTPIGSLLCAQPECIYLIWFLSHHFHICGTQGEWFQVWPLSWVQCENSHPLLLVSEEPLWQNLKGLLLFKFCWEPEDSGLRQRSRLEFWHAVASKSNILFAAFACFSSYCNPTRSPKGHGEIQHSRRGNRPIFLHVHRSTFWSQPVLERREDITLWQKFALHKKNSRFNPDPFNWRALENPSARRVGRSRQAWPPFYQLERVSHLTLDKADS